MGNGDSGKPTTFIPAVSAPTKKIRNSDVGEFEPDRTLEPPAGCRRWDPLPCKERLSQRDLSYRSSMEAGPDPHRNQKTSRSAAILPPSKRNGSSPSGRPDIRMTEHYPSEEEAGRVSVTKALKAIGENQTVATALTRSDSPRRSGWRKRLKGSMVIRGWT